MIRKGIILAGGTGTRMSPLTKAVNKQLLPIYDKPLIYYPLSVLMLSGIKDVLIIVNKGQLNQFKKILPNGKNLGIKITYAEQKYPKGLPDAFQVGKNFIGKENVALILGDNFFYGQSLTKKLKECIKLKNGASVILHPVKNPNLYGVAKINKKNKITKIVEKPKKYVNFDLSVSMGKLRSIKVFVLGEVSNPGTYDISSLSTVFFGLQAVRHKRVVLNHLDTHQEQNRI